MVTDSFGTAAVGARRRGPHVVRAAASLRDAPPARLVVCRLKAQAPCPLGLGRISRGRAAGGVRVLCPKCLQFRVPALELGVTIVKLTDLSVETLEMCLKLSDLLGQALA